MKNRRTEDRGCSQTSSSSRPSSIEALRPGTAISQEAIESNKGTQAIPLRPVLTHEEVAARAKAIWEEHGRRQGSDQADWFEAEAQLRGEQS
jgi:hypothetical protein